MLSHIAPRVATKAGVLAQRSLKAKPLAPLAAEVLHSGRPRSLVAFCSASGSNSEVKIAIEGMMCGGCSSRIENVLKGMQSVKSVSVSLEGKVAVVHLADGAASTAAAAAAALVDTINGLGFEARLSQ